MQIALFAVVNLLRRELKHHPIAHANCQLTFTGQNLQAFLCQICVTIHVAKFVVARITSVDVDIDAGEGTFGVSDGLQHSSTTVFSEPSHHDNWFLDFMHCCIFVPGCFLVQPVDLFSHSPVSHA
jgi:hypothetical protein